MADLPVRHPFILGSAGDDPSEEFFDWGRYEVDTTDATTRSDLSSEETSETSPSDQTAGTSVGTGLDPDEDVVMTDAPISPIPHEKIIWPQIPDTAPLRRPTIIHDQEDLTQLEAPSTAMTLPQGRIPSRPHVLATPDRAATAARPRIVKEPKKTGKVREVGACLHCRVKRVSCSADGVCPRCVGLCGERSDIDPAKICSRRTLHEGVGALSFRWCWSNTGLPSLGSFPSTADDMPIPVSFSDDPRSPCLLMRMGISLGDISREDDIFHWAKTELKENASRSADPSFESLVDRLLVVYVEEHALDYAAFLEKKPLHSAAPVIRYQNECLEKLLKMRCMWNVWRCRSFHIHDPNGQFLPGSRQAIQDYLHEYAGQRISELEKVVLREVDRLFAQSGIKDKTHPLLLSAHNVGMWILLWQLAMMYRESSGEMLYQQPANAAPVPIQGAPLSSRRNQFRETTGELYNKVVVLYSGLFRTSKALENLQDAGTRVFGGNQNVCRAFEGAWKSHTGFYQTFKQIYPGDELIEALVIKKETKVLSRKRQSRK